MTAEKKKLSKSILEMKFMKRSKEKLLKAQDEEEGRAIFASEVTRAMRIGGSKIIVEQSFVPCEGLKLGRFSYNGMNPEIEKLTSNEREEKDKKMVKNDDDMEISDLEMVRRYNTLIGTVSNKFKSRNKKIGGSEESPPKRAKFMKPADD